MADYPIPYPLSVGRVRAGDWASSVPDLLVAEGRYGLRIDRGPGRARGSSSRTSWRRSRPGTPICATIRRG